MTTLRILVPRDLVIKLERTMCPGACPDYSLILYGNGRVLYEGRHYVAVKGRRRGHISVTNVKNLFEEFCEVDYFSFKDQYNAITRDGAITKTSIIADGRTKAVVNCHPSEAPESLYLLEKKIDEISKSRLWVKNPSGEPVVDR